MAAKLTIDADTDYQDARDWYDSYGWHRTTEGGDLCVEYDWLNDRDDVVADKLMARHTLLRAEAEQIAAKARSIREAAEAIENHLLDAIDAYESGDVAACVAALDAAEALESEHGDSPASSALREQLLEEAAAEEPHLSAAQLDALYDAIGPHRVSQQNPCGVCFSMDADQYWISDDHLSESYRTYDELLEAARRWRRNMDNA